MVEKIVDKIMTIDLDKIDFSNPEELKILFSKLLNEYENSLNDNVKLIEIINKQKDEINRLKGEKGRPHFKPNKKDPPDDKENLEYTQKKKKTDERDREPKIPKIKIDREEVLDFSDEEKEQLPDDVVFKGYRERIVQDIKITTDNVRQKIPRLYSPNQGRTYEPVKKGLEEFGPGIHSLTHLLYFKGRVPKDKITNLFQEIGIIISGTKVLEIIYGHEEYFSKEKEDIFREGVKLTSYINTDDTGIRKDGKNFYANVYCNPFFTVYKINENKKRETIKKYLRKLGIKIQILVTDDAPQFKEITEDLALCWIHEERHYKKMNPFIDYHKKLLKNFRRKIWDFYKQLKKYKENPKKIMKKDLKKEFDELFSESCSYKDLDDRIKLTKNKKESLLLVLDYPEVPLHNNFSEQEIREFVIKRKVSGCLRSDKGVIAWENHFTILRTCRKQKISYWQYLKNYYEGIEQVPLAKRVAQSTT